jgi:hypothetical protein
MYIVVAGGWIIGLAGSGVVACFIHLHSVIPLFIYFEHCMEPWSLSTLQG